VGAVRVDHRNVDHREVDHREEVPMAEPDEAQDETYNPWSIVNLVFHHLAAQGLCPRLGDGGDPSVPAAQLLRSLGIAPDAEGNRRISRDVRQHLAEIRGAVFDET
jgi:hypothetical protein